MSLNRLAALLRPRAHRFALESRQLFDGAALAAAAAAMHPADAFDAHHAEAPGMPAGVPAAHLPDHVPAAASAVPVADVTFARTDVTPARTDGADARTVPTAAPATTAPVSDEAARPTLQPTASASPSGADASANATTGHVVYVVDESVANWQQIVASLPAGSDVVLIDPNSDGATQLAAALAGKSDVSALQVISHGADGEITLGNSTITAANIGEHAAAWAAIGASLSADGDILLYGCDVAESGNGLLVQMAGLTGADVAGSTNATGAAAMGGDWTLEASVGRIDAATFSDPGYDGLLAQPTVSTTATKLQVSEPSTLNAPGADSGQLSGWTIADASGNVSVTVTVDTLVNGVGDGTPDTITGGLTSGATGTAAASLTFSGTVADANTWLNGLVFHATDTELGNTSAHAVIDVTVTDAAQPLSASQSLAVTVTPSNDPTTLADATQSVAEVGNTVLTVATLNALDPEVDAAQPTQTPSQIVYSLTAAPTEGYLSVNGTRLGVDSIFTQADVIAGNVVYVHTASGADQDTTDSFHVTVNDGATPAALSAGATITLQVTPFNQLPTVSGSGSVLEGQPANAQSGGVALSDVGSFITASGGGDDADSTLTVQLMSLPTDGTLHFTGTVTLSDGSTQTYTDHVVTAADISAGFTFAYTARSGLTYGNDGNRDQNPATPYPFADGYDVVVRDGGGGTGVPGATPVTHIGIDVKPVDDNPVLVSSPTPVATVTAAGDSAGTYVGPYVVTLTTAMLDATDVDSSNDRITFAVTSQTGLDQGSLLLNGQLLPVGGSFTMADVIAGRVQYVQQAGAAAGDTDTFNFQVVDNTTSVAWNADGTQFQRPGGVYEDYLNTPGILSDDRLQTFQFTIDLAATPTGNGTGFVTPPPAIAAHTDSNYAGTDTSGDTRGTLLEGGSIVLAGTGADFTTTPGLSYTVDNVPPSQVVYTILGFNGAGPNWNGELQRLENGTWVDLGVYDTFTQADLNAGDIRYQHDGTSEDFQSSVSLSASAGVLVGTPGDLHTDQWQTTFNFYITPVNNAPVVTGSSSAVMAEGGTIGITSGELHITDQDDAVSESYLESPSTVAGGTGTLTLPGGGNNYAYNNDATGPYALRFVVDSLPTGGTLEYSTDGGNTWANVVAGVTQVDASVLTADASTTGLRFVSDGGETRDTTFTVHAIDRWGAVSNSAPVEIQITNVDDAPAIASRPDLPDPTVPADAPNIIGGAPQNNPLTVSEGGSGQITNALLQAYDPDSTATQVQYSITTAPAHGYIAYSTDGGATFQVLGVNSSFSQADVAAGRIYYVNDGSESTGAVYDSGQDDKFTFSISDGDKEQRNNEFWFYVSPTNDAPVVTAPSGPVAIAGLIVADNKVPGFTITDPDLTTITSGETDYVQATVRLRDANGNALPDSVYTGASIAVDGAYSSLVDTADASDPVAHNGNGTYLILRGTVENVQAALATLSVTFSDDRDTAYQLQVVADDRLRDANGVLTGGANGGTQDQALQAGGAPYAVPTTADDWGHSAVPAAGSALAGNVSASSVLIYASSVNEPATLTAPAAANVYEDQSSYVGGSFVVRDPESEGFGTPVTVHLSVPSGTLDIGGSGTQTSATINGHTVTIAGDGTGALTLTGVATDIQDLINSGATTGLTYRSAPNVNNDLNGADPGDVTLTLSFDDSGSRIGSDTGSGSVANNPPDATVALTIVPVNDAPTVAVANGIDRDTALYLAGGATPTAVTGLSVGDIDIVGDGGGVAAGETDFVQATVRITDANGTPLAASLYNGTDLTNQGLIVIGSSASATNPDGSGGAFAVDGTLNGNDSALVVRGTLSQVNAYLAGLTVSIAGSGLGNSDSAYRVQVVADDRVRDLTTGALVDSDGNAANGVQPIANGGNDDNGGNGTIAPPATAVDAYSAVPAGLGQNVASNYRTVFVTGYNDPAHINGTPAGAAEANPTITLSNLVISDQDAQPDSVLTTTVSVPAGFSIASVGAGSGGTAVISGDGLSVTLTGTLAQINSRIDTIAVQFPDPDGAGPAQRSDWNGTFSVTVVVDDNGNTGGRPPTLATGDNTTTGTFAYENATGNALVTTRTFDVTVTPTNDAPVLAGTTGVRSVSEYPNAANTPGVPEVLLVDAGTANLTDIDLTTTAGLNATTFGAGSITVSLGATYFAGDQLTISGIAGTPLPAGFSWSGGTGGAPLVISFGTGTTVAQVEQVIERLAYSSTSDNPTNYDAAANRTRSYTIVVNDGDNLQTGGANAGGPAALNSNALAGTIAITAVDDPPVANDDARTVNEDGPPITGNVITGGAPGDVADTDVDNRITDLVIGGVRTGPEAGTGTAGTVGTALAGNYGSLVLNANGSYTYTLDNANPVVNALKTGQSLTETYTYTLSDGHGGTDTAQITITIAGHTDGPPTIVPVDENGAATGQATVYESGLTTDGPTGQSATTTGVIDVSAPDGLRSISVGGTTLTAAQLAALSPAAPVVITTADGTLSLTGYAAGALSYSYTLSGAQHQTGTESTDSIALTVTDLATAPDTGTAAGTLVVRIVNDVPTARPDTAAITEDATPATVAGNVVANDRLGADGSAAGGPVTALAFGANAGTVGNSLTTAYGSIVLNADGSYVYTLDNTNTAVNALKTGQSLTDVVNYTITDGDGNTSASTLTVTIAGHTDGAPTIVPADTNGAATGQATVYESGLTTDGPPGQSSSASGTIAVSAADGLQSVSVGGRVLTTAQLAALSAGTPVSIATADGTLLLTGFTVDSRVGGLPTGVPTSGTLQYTYTLGAAQHQTGADSTDVIALAVTDLSGAPVAGSGSGALTVDIVNDVPTARPDTAAITEDAVPDTVAGSVITNDRIGADGAAAGGPVTGFSVGAATGTVGNSLTTAYGAIVLNANGSYVYTLDNTNPTVNALKDGETLTEVVNYTITDGDGNSSASTLTVTINGHTDVAGGPTIAAVDNNGAAAGQVDVYEHGLTDGPTGPDTSERNGGLIAVSAGDGLSAVTIGGTTLTAAQLQALGTTPVTIHTPDGTLVLTGFTNVVLNGTVPISGDIVYTYTLDHAVNQPNATESIDPIALSVLDGGGATSSGVLGVRVIDDVPTAADDRADITEDGAPTVSGSVKANDRDGADDSNGVPVTAVAFGGTAGTVGSPLTTAYGSIVLNADGSYVYTLDNSNPAVQHLIAGESLTETVRYTITDADGDTSSASLVITIHGSNDPAGLKIVDGNGAADGQASVYERGLTSVADTSETTTGTFVVSAPDGLTGIEVAGTAVTPAQLAGLGSQPVVIDTALGHITLTGFDPATGAVSYSYTLGATQSQAAGEVLDHIAITVHDRGGDSTTGILGVLVVDDVPTANNDFATIGTALPGATVSGNVVGGAGSGPGDVADRIGADYTATPVSGFSFDGHAGVVGGAGLAGNYGTLRLAADGSYTYAVNTSNSKVASLAEGQTLTEVFHYTITDSDGSSSSAELVVTIKGNSPARPPAGDDVWPADFYEPTRAISQAMEPALFVQLAVRESQQLSQDASAAIATRVAGGVTIAGPEHHEDDYAYGVPPPLGQPFAPAEHVIRDGVAFSQALVRDIELSLAQRGLGDGLPAARSDALFGDFDAFAGPRIVIAGARPAADAAPAPQHGMPRHARSFSERLQAAAGERGTVHDRVRLQSQQPEKLRVAAPAPVPAAEAARVP